MNSEDTTTLRAEWAAEFAWYSNQVGEHLLETAAQTLDDLVAKVDRRKGTSADNWKPREPEEIRLASKTRAMAHTSVLQALLAIEIALKAYQIRDTGQNTRTHNLQRLFNSLKDETRTRLENLGPEIKSTLQKHPEGFVDLRYPFEQLGNLKRFDIPRPTDPLYVAATKIVEALKMDFFGETSSS